MRRYLSTEDFLRVRRLTEEEGLDEQDALRRVLPNLPDGARLSDTQTGVIELPGGVDYVPVVRAAGRGIPMTSRVAQPPPVTTPPPSSPAPTVPTPPPAPAAPAVPPVAGPVPVPVPVPVRALTWVIGGAVGLVVLFAILSIWRITSAVTGGVASVPVALTAMPAYVTATSTVTPTPSPTATAPAWLPALPQVQPPAQAPAEPHAPNGNPITPGWGVPPTPVVVYVPQTAPVYVPQPAARAPARAPVSVTSGFVPPAPVAPRGTGGITVLPSRGQVVPASEAVGGNPRGGMFQCAEQQVTIDDYGTSVINGGTLYTTNYDGGIFGGGTFTRYTNCTRIR